MEISKSMMFAIHRSVDYRATSITLSTNSHNPFVRAAMHGPLRSLTLFSPSSEKESVF